MRLHLFVYQMLLYECVYASRMEIQCKLISLNFAFVPEALPGHVQLHGSGARRGFSPGGRPDPGRGADRRGLGVRDQPAHGAARDAARQLRAACVMSGPQAVDQEQQQYEPRCDSAASASPPKKISLSK